MITFLNLDRNQYDKLVSEIRSRLTQNKTLPRIQAATVRASLNAPFSECHCDKCGAKGTLTVYGTYENKCFDGNADAKSQKPLYILRLRCEECGHKPSVFPYDGRPFSSVNINVILVGLFGTLKENDPSVVEETPAEEGSEADSEAETEAQTGTTAITPVVKVELGNGFWFDGEEVYSSKGPLGKLGLDRTSEEWDFPLSISTICRFKKCLKENFELIECTLVQLGLCPSQEPLSLKGAIKLILFNLKKFLEKFWDQYNIPFLSGASFEGGRFFFGYGHYKS